MYCVCVHVCVSPSLSASLLLLLLLLRILFVPLSLLLRQPHHVGCQMLGPGCGVDGPVDFLENLDDLGGLVLFLEAEVGA